MHPDGRSDGWKRHLLSLRDVAGSIESLADRALTLAAKPTTRKLKGRRVGVLFTRSSTRTRIAFTAAIDASGATAVPFTDRDLQLSTGETPADTARVLAQYLDALVVRTNGPLDDIQAFACQSEMAVINALTIDDHPTQVVADLTTILERFGHLRDIRALYLGGGNSTSASLALGFAQIPGARLTLVTPSIAPTPVSVAEDVSRLSATFGGHVEEHHDPTLLPKAVDVVYTSRWKTMGEGSAWPEWREKFEPFQVNERVFAQVAHGETVLLHDLPAVRGEEVTASLLDGERSLVLRQAFHKMTAAMAVLEWTILCDNLPRTERPPGEVRRAEQHAHAR